MYVGILIARNDIIAMPRPGNLTGIAATKSALSTEHIMYHVELLNTTSFGPAIRLYRKRRMDNFTVQL